MDAFLLLYLLFARKQKGKSKIYDIGYEILHDVRRDARY